MARIVALVMTLMAGYMLFASPAGATPLPVSGGGLENVATDPTTPGGIFVANAEAKAIQRMTLEGGYETFVANVSDPGAVVVHGNLLYFATGNSGSSLLPTSSSQFDGTIETVDLSGEGRTLVAGGLTAPNGITFVGDQLFYTTAGGFRQGVYAIRDGKSVLVNSAIPLPDGLTTGVDGQIYVGSLAGGIYRLDPETGAWSMLTWTPGPIDDLTVFDGRIYAASTLGVIYNINPAGGSPLVAAAGPEFVGASSVKPGLGGLIVTALSGTLNLIQP